MAVAAHDRARHFHDPCRAVVDAWRNVSAAKSCRKVFRHGAYLHAHRAGVFAIL
jgi:hypothetical protein